MTAAGKAYLAAVIASGLTAVLVSLYQLYQHPLAHQWYMLAALTLVSGSATVNLPSVGASISVSETFVFSSVLLFGPAAGTIMVALDGLVISFWMAKRRPEWYRALFNMAAPAISIWLAAQLLFAIARVQPLFGKPQSSVNVLLLPLLIFAIVYFGLNSSLIALAVSFERRSSAYRIWRENFLWLSLNYFSGASVALLLVVYTRDVDLRFIGVIVPLLLVLYFTFKTTMGRVEDANAHLQQLNRLYLSTIETLAMAIDAKDQITHGHIRRVQRFAVGLAANVGVSDETLIKAIEAAALLHDMGKLAVPEYILNKPGKLTPAEFEKMKAHAAVGADILNAVEFPYPVVPIVRHHHENWDGTGYPDGLKGTDIPIGARILSVVDCFDALTSDRPYRPRLNDEDAIAILMQRRGSMYDPLIVDTFLRVYKQITPDLPEAKSRAAFGEITQSALPSVESSTLDEIAARADESSTIYALAMDLSRQVTHDELIDTLFKHLRRLIPFGVCVYFRFDETRDELEAVNVIGGHHANIEGLRIPIAQRLSGWVAANRQTILNSDPVLDLGEVARSTPRLRSCLSTALVSGDLVGVMSLYSTAPDAFTEDHRRIIETVAKQAAQLLKRSSQQNPQRDIAAGSIQFGVQRTDSVERRPTQDLSLIRIEVPALKEIANVRGRPVGEAVLKHVALLVRRILGVSDILVHVDNDDFVAVIQQSDTQQARLMAATICDIVAQNPLTLASGETLSVNVTATPSAGQSGASIRELVAALGDQVKRSVKFERTQTIH